jgi:hypothetical protein
VNNKISYYIYGLSHKMHSTCQVYLCRKPFNIRNTIQNYFLKSIIFLLSFLTFLFNKYSMHATAKWAYNCQFDFDGPDKKTNGKELKFPDISVMQIKYLYCLNQLSNLRLILCDSQFKTEVICQIPLY